MTFAQLVHYAFQMQCQCPPPPTPRAPQTRFSGQCHVQRCRQCKSEICLFVNLQRSVYSFNTHVRPVPLSSYETRKPVVYQRRALQAGVIHLWAPRFADFSYWVSKNIYILRYLFWELQNKIHRKNENLQQKLPTKPVPL